jgi:RimJ/RimL family protein N-acetyltransferase
MAAKGPGSVEPRADAVPALRSWADGDLALLERASEDDYVPLIEHIPTPFDPGLARAWVEARGETEWVIVAAGEPVGGVGYALRHVPGLAEVGYWIVPERRGAGLATAAVELVVSRAFTAGIERLQATVEPWNVPSQRVLEKAGFDREGLLRGYARWGDEPRRDIYLYARLA